MHYLYEWVTKSLAEQRHRVGIVVLSLGASDHPANRPPRGAATAGSNEIDQIVAHLARPVPYVGFPRPSTPQMLDEEKRRQQPDGRPGNRLSEWAAQAADLQRRPNGYREGGSGELRGHGQLSLSGTGSDATRSSSESQYQVSCSTPSSGRAEWTVSSKRSLA